MLTGHRLRFHRSNDSPSSQFIGWPSSQFIGGPSSQFIGWPSSQLSGAESQTALDVVLEILIIADTVGMMIRRTEPPSATRHPRIGRKQRSRSTSRTKQQQVTVYPRKSPQPLRAKRVMRNRRSK